MKQSLKSVIVTTAIIIVLICGLLFGGYTIGKHWDDWKLKRELRNAPPDPVVIGYTLEGGLSFIPPKGSVIQIDTVNHKIIVVDSLWIEYQKKLNGEKL